MALHQLTTSANKLMFLSLKSDNKNISSAEACLATRLIISDTDPKYLPKFFDSNTGITQEDLSNLSFSSTASSTNNDD